MKENSGRKVFVYKTIIQGCTYLPPYSTDFTVDNSTCCNNHHVYFLVKNMLVPEMHEYQDQ
jgi:hypothetical protein